MKWKHTIGFVLTALITTQASASLPNGGEDDESVRFVNPTLSYQSPEKNPLMTFGEAMEKTNQLNRKMVWDAYNKQYRIWSDEKALEYGIKYGIRVSVCGGYRQNQPTLGDLLKAHEILKEYRFNRSKL
jgi:hypothetical protein